MSGEARRSPPPVPTLSPKAVSVAPPERRRPLSPRQLALERGRTAERRVLAACGSPRRPSWMLTARRGGRAEDRAGIDVVLETDVGRLFLQVKSSRRGMATFLEKKRRRERIAIVVVRPGDSNRALLQRVVLAVGAVRDLYLAERRLW